MPKTDQGKLAMLLKQVSAKYGEDALYRLGEKQVEIAKVTTGLPELDSVIGGGIPEGRLVEMYGLYSSGKTSLAYQVMSRYDQSLFIDMEGTFDPERAKVFGCKDGEVYIRRPQWGEQAFELMMDAADAGIPLIVLDSVPCMIPRKEYDNQDMEKQVGVGMVAGLMSRKLPKLCSICEKTGTSIIFINQVRDKIGLVIYGETTSTPGGHALRHLCSLRLQVARKGWIEVSDEKMGQIVKVRVVKSKVCAPQKECELSLLYDVGFTLPEEVRPTLYRIRRERKQNAKAKQEEGNGLSEGTEEDNG